MTNDPGCLWRCWNNLSWSARLREIHFDSFWIFLSSNFSRVLVRKGDNRSTLSYKTVVYYNPPLLVYFFFHWENWLITLHIIDCFYIYCLAHLAKNLSPHIMWQITLLRLILERAPNTNTSTWWVKLILLECKDASVFLIYRRWVVEVYSH